MLLKFNKGILFLLIALFGFGLYRLVVLNEFYPYSLLLIGTLLSIGVYFCLITIPKIPSKPYAILTIFALLNLGLLFSDYFYPQLLRSTWNYSFSLFFLVLVIALLNSLKKIKGKLSTFTFWSTLFSGLLIGTALLFKVSSTFYYSLVFYSFLVSTISNLLLFGSQFKKVKKSVQPSVEEK